MKSTKKQPFGYPLYETTVFEDFRVMVENVAKRVPDHPALSYRVKPTDEEAVRITYEQARCDIRDYGTGLVDLGCREKTCAIIGGSSVGWVYTYFALMAIGAVTVPLDKEWNENDLATTVAKAECEYVFYTADAAKKIETVAAGNPQIKKYVCFWGDPREGDLTLEQIKGKGKELFEGGDNTYYDYEIKRDALATIVFTSGTTGKGKGVMLSQTNIVSDMTQGMYLFDITRKTLCVLPPQHTYASTVNFVGHYSQGCEIYMSSGLKYIQKELKQEKPTHLILVPLFVETFYKKILSTIRKEGKEKSFKTGLRLSKALMAVGIDRRRTIFTALHDFFGCRLQMILCGGAALNQDIIDFFESIGVIILNGYGITECAPLISCNRNLWRKKGSVGLPIIGEQVRIHNPNEKGEGEICAKGPNVMLGYFKDEEATAAVLDSDGYFHTGDFGRIDKEGWIYITGRIKNIIVLSNGKNVYPEEIENEISRIPGISEIVVHEGINKLGKQVLVAEIFPDEEYMKSQNIAPENYRKYFETEIFDKLNPTMAPYKQIKYVKVRDVEFAKNTSRKITRFSIDKNIDE